MSGTKFEPVFVGTSPAGVEWWARKPGDEAKMRARLAKLHASSTGATFVVSDAAKQIRSILQAKSHGEAKSFSRTDKGITYRARYKAAIDRVAALVREAGGKIVDVGKAGKMRRLPSHQVTQPNFITFTLGERGDAFIMRPPEPRRVVAMGRSAK